MTGTPKLQHVFGPVPSRRLGRSLGVDVVPFKTCTYDCIYCQLGRTTNKTIERAEYVPLADVIRDVKRSLDQGAPPDFVTISGSGEPTLYSQMGRLVRTIKQTTEIPVAVLTNGSYLWHPDVQSDLLDADLVIPSLDAGDEKLFQYVNRPCKAITFDRMIDGLLAFRRRFPGPIWLEVFLLGGVTAMESEVRKIASHVREICPERLQLNTVARPPAESYALQVPDDQMARFAEMFDPPGEVVVDVRQTHEQEIFQAAREDVLRLLKRRPCSLQDVASGLGIHVNEATKHLEHLLGERQIQPIRKGDSMYYTVVPEPPE
jgi:wyosine [tRNA(Phe)-imidazoG37] synthetase (radical SAM superfamily)